MNLKLAGIFHKLPVPLMVFVDGSHIPIVRPHEYSHIDYFNRKQFYSIVLQAVVDYRYCFWDITVG